MLLLISCSYVIINILPQQVMLTLPPLCIHLLRSSYHPSLPKTFPCNLWKKDATLWLTVSEKPFQAKLKKHIQKQATYATLTAGCYLLLTSRSLQFHFDLRASKCLKLNLQHIQNYRKKPTSLFPMPWHCKRHCSSQNHKIVGVGRDLCGSSSPPPLPKQGHPEQAAQGHVQVGLEYLQRRRNIFSFLPRFFRRKKKIKLLREISAHWYCRTGQQMWLKLPSYFHSENISLKVVFYLGSLHKHRKCIKTLLGFKILKTTLGSSDISNSLWESQELTIFFRIGEADCYTKLVTGLAEHGTPCPHRPAHHLL